MEEQLPRKFGKYTLLRKLAVGGMAEIFLALHRSISGFEKLLVIKRILPNLTQDPEFLQMFLDEARIAATLNHPNIVQIYDVGSVGEATFIAMEYVHGEDLRSIVRGMKKKGITTFPLEHALQIIVGACAGLDFAHSRTDLKGEPLEIVHRDISPQNVLVTFAGDVKVVDFGIARAKMAGLEEKTDRGQLKGKIPYMSPEQCRGEDLDHRSDIFSLGIILFELTTGRRLFRGETEFVTMRRILEDPYPRPSQFVAGYAPDLEGIVMKALARDRDQRYQSARELQADLEEFIRHHRIAASSLNLSKFLQEIFGDKLATQRDALAQGKRLADIIAEEEDRAPEIPSDQLVELDAQDQPISDAAVPRPDPSTGAWVEEKRPSWAKRLAMAAVALVLVVGIGGAVLFFTRPGETTTSEPTPLGLLEVSSTPPGAAITIDSEPTDEVTPHTFGELRVDRTYQVKLSLDGYRHAIREVKLSAGQPRETVSLELRPAAKGIISVTSVPTGASVFFDGRALDETTPATIAEVSPVEEHTILIKLAGFVDRTETVTVSPGEVRDLAFELEEAPLGPQETFLVIESEPTEARVTLDGEALDQPTPLKKRLAAGQRVTVEVNKSGYRSFQKRVALPGGETITVVAELERDRERSGGGGGGTSTKVTGTGRLWFNAVPYCNVTIDGRSYGATPLVGIELPAGRHTIRCTSPPIGVTKTVPVNIPPDGAVRRQIKLTP